MHCLFIFLLKMHFQKIVCGGTGVVYELCDGDHSIIPQLMSALMLSTPTLMATVPQF
jgi:hypothetical protein